MYYLSKIDEIFTEAFRGFSDDFSWSSVVILVTGILIGFIISTCVYLILFLINIKKEEVRQIDKSFFVDQEELENKIEEIKEDFIHNSEGLSMKEKTDMLGSAIFNVTNIVASTYYPNSKYPLYELSIDELIKLLKYLSDRIDGVFSRTILKPFRKMTVSQVFRLLDAKKKIEENKLIKTANKAKPNKIFKAISTVINYANPFYWIKRVVINTTINLTLNKVFLLVIDIVSDETNKAYSKSIFNEEHSLNEKAINQALIALDEEIKED